MRPTRPFACIVAAALAGGASTLWAQADPGEAEVKVEVTQTLAAPLAAPSLPQLGADHTTQTMLWRHRGPVGFGLGVEQRSTALAGLGLLPRHDTLLFGLSFATGERTRLSWQTAADHDTRFAHRPMRVSLSFQATDPIKELRRGALMRMELSGQTTIALRARGGRLGVALTSRW